MKFDALILAAGFGKRMMPLSKNTPKPLIQINEKAIIDYSIKNLNDNNIENIIVNSHYKHKKIFKHFKENHKIKTIYEPSILETGGAVINIINLLNETFFVINGDSIWKDFKQKSLKKMTNEIKNKKAVLLLSSKKNSFGYSGNGDFDIDNNGKITRNKKNGEYVFTGIQIFKKEAFSKELKIKNFSLNKIYDFLIEKKELYGTILDGKYFHVGNPDSIKKTEIEIKK